MIGKSDVIPPEQLLALCALCHDKGPLALRHATPVTRHSICHARPLPLLVVIVRLLVRPRRCWHPFHERNRVQRRLCLAVGIAYLAKPDSIDQVNYSPVPAPWVPAFLLVHRPQLLERDVDGLILEPERDWSILKRQKKVTNRDVIDSSAAIPQPQHA